MPSAREGSPSDGSEDARRALENAVRIQPFYAEAHYNLATLLDQIGLPAEALSEFEQAIALKPGLANLLGERLGQLREVVRGKS